jgi:hypothetical protein
MTKTIRRWLLASLAVAAVGASGCIITSAQILAAFDLPNPFTINSTTDPFERVLVDLNTIEDYADNKDKLKGLTDFAVLGTFVNESGPAGGVEVWVTADNTNYTSVGEVTTNGTKLWGPGQIGASGTAEGTVTLSWDDSAALFTSAGKTIVINEANGDGAFTLYTFGTAGLYQIRVDNGSLVLVLDASL